MDPSLNSTPMDLLNATEDSSPCNSTPMNRAHALGVSVGEDRDRRAFARVQRDCVGYMELRLKLKYTWQLFLVCLYRSSTAGCPQAVQISITTVVEVASGKGHA